MALNKIKQSPNVVLRKLKLLDWLELIHQSPEQIRKAVEIKHLYKIGFWYACIISNAEQVNCSEINSENLNTGQFYFGIQIVNHFL